MNRLSHHLRGNAVAYLALFVALGGSSYAAINLPAGSVGPRQIRNHSITPIKFDPTKIGASVRYWAVVDGNGRVLASQPKPQTSGFGGSGTGVLNWGRITRKCFPVATVDDDLPGFVTASFQGEVAIRTYGMSGTPAPRTVAVALLCSG
jgi:hypothetical protein